MKFSKYNFPFSFCLSQMKSLRDLHNLRVQMSLSALEAWFREENNLPVCLTSEIIQSSEVIQGEELE